MNGEDGGLGRTQTDDREGGGKRFWRAVSLKGQGKAEAKGESGNNQIVEGGEGKLSLPLHCLPP